MLDLFYAHRTEANSVESTKTMCDMNRVTTDMIFFKIPPGQICIFKGTDFIEMQIQLNSAAAYTRHNQ